MPKSIECSRRVGQLKPSVLGYRSSKYFGNLIGVWFLMFGACCPVPVFCSSALSNPATDRAIVSPDSSLPTATSGQIPASIQTLALAAKKVFRERIQPPIPKLNFIDVIAPNRDLFSVLKDYAQKSFDDAIDALAAEATNSERAHAVENALRKFVAVQQTRPADAIFAEMIARKSADARIAAATLRHSVALVELPNALAKVLPDATVKQFSKSSRELLFPHTENVLPTYKRAAELDPDDAWTWIIVAILENDSARSESPIRNGLRAAIAADDWQATVFSRQLFGWFVLDSRGQFAEADRSYAEALALARERSALDSSDIDSRRELTRDLVWTCVTKANHTAAAEARAACEEALSIRKQIVASRPDDMRERADLIASYWHLGSILRIQGLQDEADKNFKEGQRLYLEIADQSGFVPGFNPLDPRALPANVLDVLVAASVFTPILGLIALAIYRRRITHLMRATAKKSTIQGVQSVTPSIPASGGAQDIAIKRLDAAEASRTTSYRSESLSRAKAALRNAAWAYAIAGCAFAAVATFQSLHFADMEFRPNRVAIVFLVWIWPVILTLNFLWGQDRRRLGFLMLAYFGVLLGFCLKQALSDTPTIEIYGVMTPPFFQPLILWGHFLVPTLFLLLFLNRSVRAIGPMMFAFMVVVMCGYVAGKAVGSVHIVIKALVALKATLVNRLGMHTLTLTGLIGAAFFAPLGWILIGVIRRRYEAKRLSDQTMIFDSIWLFQTFFLYAYLYFDVGSQAWVALAAFGVYKVISRFSLLLLTFGASQQRPATLLLLRTFGFRRRSERFFNQLSAHWRYAGPIQLIAAPDLAGRSIDPPKFLDFLSGRLHRRFVKELPDLERRLAAFDNGRDRDGRYRVNELFCSDDAWREAVRRLMETSDLVVMDLRGFTAKNQGCIFELQSLIDHVAIGKIVLLVDERSVVSFLRQTLDGCWHKMASASPNRESTTAVTLLNVGSHETLAVDALLSLADEMLTKPKTLGLTLLPKVRAKLLASLSRR